MTPDSDTIARPAPFVRLYWSRRDQLRAVTVIGLVGLTLAALMAAFGLPPIDLHGPLHRFGIMDPLCGGTRAARLTAQGDLAEAWRYNPLGIVAVVAAAVAATRLLVGLATRRWLNVQMGWTSRRARYVVTAVVVLLVVLEIRQQGRADLLLRPH